jgi:rod shape-determining protein MreC
VRNIIRFLVRFHFFILFVLFEILSIYLLFQHNRFQRAAFLNFTNETGGAFHKQITAITTYLNLKKQNDVLVIENAYLRTKIASLSKPDSIALHPDTSNSNRLPYSYISAFIVDNSVNQQNNYIIIDKGSKHGIKPEMAVICSSGIIGITKNVSENYSLVISALNRNFKLSAKIKRNSYFGSLVWDGLNERIALLNEIPFHVDIKNGDTLITSGYSAIFPEGINVGKIIKFNKPAGTNFYEICIELSTDFRNISYVYVINHLHNNELGTLKKKESNDL